MSASGGQAIQMSAVLDLAGPYRDLAAFRTAAAQPVNIGSGFTAPAAGGATFNATTGGTPYPATSVINAYRPTGLGPVLYGQQAASAGFGGSGLGGGGAGANAQLNAAVAQFSQAIQAMAQMARQAAAGYARSASDVGGGASVDTDEDAGGSGRVGGRGGGRGNLFTRGTARLFSGYFLLREGANIAEGYRERQISQELDAERGTGTRLRELQTQAAFEQRQQSIPFYGEGRKIGRMLTGEDKEDERKRLEAEDSEKDWRSGLGIRASRRQTLAQIASIDRNTAVYGQTGNFERENIRIGNRYRDQEEKSRAEGQTRLAEIADLRNPASPLHDAKAADRKQNEFNQWREDEQKRLNSLFGNTKAEIAERTRVNQLIIDSTNRSTPGLIARASGKLGAADNADFVAEQADRLAKAREQGGGALPIAIRQNELRAAAREEGIQFDTRERYREREATNFELNRDPYQAGIARIQTRLARDLRGARSVAEGISIVAENFGEQQRFRQDFNDSTRVQARRFDDASSRLDILNDRSIDPYARSVRAHSNDILTDVRNQSEDATKSGRGAELLPKIQRLAQARFDQERNQLLEGIQGANIDPTLTPTSGVGTFNLGAAIGGIEDDKKRIAAEQAAGVGAATAGTPTGEAIAKSTDQLLEVLKALPGLSDILAALNKLQGQ